MKIATIFGTRPEIIKLSTLIPQLDMEFDQVLIHTGQHYSYKMDKIFFDELKLRDCDYTLNIGSGTHAQQTGKMLIELEKVLLLEKPDLVMVQGDTNSTLAGALAASKLHIPVAHVEAGCRSFDKQMPEEINRILVDNISDYLFTPDENSYKNLTCLECFPSDKVYLVGNTSVDACLRTKQLNNQEYLKSYNLEKRRYILFTLHRQENTAVDRLKEIIMALNMISGRIKVLFPAHLRTRKVILENKIEISDNIILTDPLGYNEFMGLLVNSKFIMTDSGGIQEEAPSLGKPVLVARETTERPEGVEAGSARLVGVSIPVIVESASELLTRPEVYDRMSKVQNPYGDGKAAERICAHTLDYIESRAARS